MEYKTSSTQDAQFVTRTHCITCEKTSFTELSAGEFVDEPLQSFLDEDPWGKNPMNALENATWSFVQCDHCGQKFHRNILNEEWINTYYSVWISDESIEQHSKLLGNHGFSHDFRKGIGWVERALWLEKMTRNIRGSNTPRVLDFGCGEGAFLSTCGSMGFESVGVEFSAAREKTKQVDYFQTLEQVEQKYGLGYFHVATLFQVLEHLTNPLDILKQLNKHMVPGAILVLETPDCINVSDIKTAQDYRLIHPLGHINGFSGKTQEEMAKQAGFSRVNPAVVQVTADIKRVVKREIRRLVQPIMKQTTDQVFIKK